MQEQVELGQTGQASFILLKLRRRVMNEPIDAVSAATAAALCSFIPKQSLRIDNGADLLMSCLLLKCAALVLDPLLAGYSINKIIFSLVDRSHEESVCH